VQTHRPRPAHFGVLHAVQQLEPAPHAWPQPVQLLSSGFTQLPLQQ
jgi:hypothetical protein